MKCRKCEKTIKEDSYYCFDCYYDIVNRNKQDTVYKTPVQITKKERETILHHNKKWHRHLIQMM